MIQVNSQHVLDCIDDLELRLRRLYDTLDQWMESIPHDRIERGRQRQTVEPLMRQLHIAPRDLPTYTIYQGKKRIAFIPAALWVVGTNGRVNVTTNKKQHSLVDRGDQEQGSKWQLAVDDYKR